LLLLLVVAAGDTATHEVGGLLHTYVSGVRAEEGLVLLAYRVVAP